MKIVKNILFYLAAALLAAAILLMVIPQFFGVRMLAVVSPSMEPEIPVGSMIVTVPVAIGDLQVDDDVTFVRNESLVLITHRVIAIDEENGRITTQGIANNTADAPVSIDNIVGRVVFRLPLAGYPINWLSSVRGKIIAATAIVVLLIVYAMIGVMVRRDHRNT